mmetsp:Transcript_20916/g.21030  ORF Transcript_20916/g.21030 Transcript_20916/m.21030 type:complete len:165 (+) Transcript_20916:51-545(+)
MCESPEVCNDDVSIKRLRSGQWTTEEESYASELIDLFLSGNIGISARNGQTLRSFLAKKLECDPMRISKKFAAFEGLLAKRFERDSSDVGDFISEQNMVRLQNLERIFLVKDVIVQSNRVKRRKYYDKSQIRSKIRKCFDSRTSTDVSEIFNKSDLELDFSIFD